MRIAQFALLAVAAIAFAGSPVAQAQTSNVAKPQKPIYGYVDLATLQFHPEVKPAVTPDSGLTLTSYWGTVAVVVTTTISSYTLKNLPAGYSVLCDLNISASAGGFTYLEVAASPATINGDTATCTMYVPYLWTGPSTAGFTFGGDYKVTASYAPGGDTQPLTDFNVFRQTQGVLYNTTGDTFSVPANGTTTVFHMTATM